MATKDELELEEEKLTQQEETGTETEDMGSVTPALPGYQSKYTEQLEGLYDQIANRQPFSYDVNSDAMYQALKDQYITGGQMAMMDTMGQAATLTGGYGNSYAQGVGQQAYQGYLQGLNEQLPDLYDMALENYLTQGDQLTQQYSMLQNLEAQDYSRYQDQMSLIQPQVLAMLDAGVRPSDEMIAASGLGMEYLNALYPQVMASSGGAGGDDSDWAQVVQDWWKNHDGGGEEIDLYKDFFSFYNKGLSGDELRTYLYNAWLDPAYRNEATELIGYMDSHPFVFNRKAAN